MSELSDRQKRVLELNANGLTQREIAKDMGDITLRGVRHIIEKLKDLGHDIQVNKKYREKVEAAREMLKNGERTQKIVSATGVSRNSIAKWKSEAKLCEGQVKTQDALSPLERRILDMNAQGFSQRAITRQIGYVNEKPLRRILHDLAARGYDVSFRNIYRSNNHKLAAEMVLAGKTSKEIADELGLCISTVKSLMTRARSEGLLPPPSRADFLRISSLQNHAKSLRQLGSAELDYGGRRYDDPAPRKCGK